MIEFEGVVPALGRALDRRGYLELTPVQKAVLAPELRDADALVSAQTGSGKTVAFGLSLAPTLLDGAERFGPAQAPLALAVAPTRELALQVKRELEWLYEMTGASVASCVGGMDMRTERRALQQGAHIVVGTPGRLRDHIDRGSLNTKGLKAVVLDEADEMLDLGFREDLEFILDAAPDERRTLMFSATVPASIAKLAKRYQRDAVRVTTQAEKKQHLDIEYRALTVTPNDRENAIVNVLRYFEAKNALVFCSTRATVNHMTSRFANRGFAVVALSGELNQNERTHALQAMRDGRARVCVATDVAARGLDLPNLELVVHADLPNNSDTLLHRSGRTGRAGRKGVSVLIVPFNQRRRTERLLQNANINATWARPPSVDDVLRRDDERILGDPALSEPVTEDEQAFVAELLNRHSAEQVAAAYVRLSRVGRSAPEELRDTGAPEPRSPGPRAMESRPAGKPPRDDFTGGVWFSLSVGRKQKAEARWLLPMLCRAGQITKHDIGAIRIHENETHIELAPACVDLFVESIGPDRTVEKTITVTRHDGKPPVPGDRGDASPSRDRPVSDDGPRAYDRARSDRRSAAPAKAGPKSPYPPKPDAAPDAPAPLEPAVQKPGFTPHRSGESGRPASYDRPRPDARSSGRGKFADDRTHAPRPGAEKPHVKSAKKPRHNPDRSGAATVSEPYADIPPTDAAKPALKRKFEPRTDAMPGAKAKPGANAKPGTGKLQEKPLKKPKRKKANDKKSAKPGAKDKSAQKPGSAPLRRKKPRPDSD